jgi:hypothetical protein
VKSTLNEIPVAALIARAREFRLHATTAGGVPELHAALIKLAREYERIAQERRRPCDPADRHAERDAVVETDALTTRSESP